MCKVRTILSLLVLLSTFSFSYAGNNKPAWANGFYRDLDNSYIKVITAQSSTRDEARKKAIEEIIADRSKETGARFNVAVDASGNIYVSGSDDLNVKARVLDEYYEVLQNGNHLAFILVQVAKHPMIDFDKADVTNKYNYVGESFIPGMAQIKKGQTAKGFLLIAAETACIGTIIVAEAQRSSFKSKIKTTQSAHQMLSYKDKSKNWETARNIAIAGTAAFYVWNVVDGIVAKGKKHIKIGGKDVAMSPWAIPEASGLAMRITF